MKKLVLAIGASSLAIGGLLSSPAAARPDRECRREVVKLCGINRGKIRECLRARSDQLSETCRSQIQDMAVERMRKNNKTIPVAENAVTVSFGPDTRQKVDFYKPASPSANPPLVLFVHGGAWVIGDRSRVQLKPEFFSELGYAFASAGYRLVPDVTVERQAEDIGAAVESLRSQADTLGFDPDRIILMGHSAGAHLAALVATDPQYLDNNLDAVAGVILLDGAGYNVPARMDGGGRGSALYERAFGDDPALQARLSPINHTAAPNAQNWLILHVATRADSQQQSQELAQELRENGASVSVRGVRNTDHGRLNRELGSEESEATAMVAEFLSALAPVSSP